MQFPHENVIGRKVESRGILLTVVEHRSPYYELSAKNIFY